MISWQLCRLQAVVGPVLGLLLVVVVTSALRTSGQLGGGHCSLNM